MTLVTIMDMGIEYAEVTPETAKMLVARGFIYLCDDPECGPFYHVSCAYDSMALGKEASLQVIDDAIAECTEVEGCGAEGPNGYRCTHHNTTEHVARGAERGSFAESWPLDG